MSAGDDLRSLPLQLRKNHQGEIGPDLFRHAYLMGLEGLVSKHRERPYRAGRSPQWIKVSSHHSIERVKEAFRCPRAAG